MNEGFENSHQLISEREITDFATRLELAGYSNALNLIKNSLLPLAIEKKISLIDAALEYANQDEEQDTSYFQLFHALQKLSGDEKS